MEVLRMLSFVLCLALSYELNTYSLSTCPLYTAFQNSELGCGLAWNQVYAMPHKNKQFSNTIQQSFGYRKKNYLSTSQKYLFMFRRTISLF